MTALNQTEPEILSEASDRLAGAISAMQDAAIQFPSRELSVAITEAQAAALWFRQAAPPGFCSDCGNRTDFEEVPR